VLVVDAVLGPLAVRDAPHRACDMLRRLAVTFGVLLDVFTQRADHP
jgi:hypothetical protein